MDGLRIAQGAISAAQTSLNTTANNLANVNTAGFRSRDVNFQTGPGGRGVEVGSTAENASPGPVVFTGQPLDLALGNDNAFFAVRQASGRLAFTRDGSFTIDGQGRIASQRGDLLDPPITVPRDATGVSVGRDGVVSAARADGSTSQIGQIAPVTFPNAGGLTAIGNNSFVPNAASGQGTRVGAGGADIIPGAETLSNTDIATQMINLIRDERFTQFAVALAKTEDENLGTILDLKR